MQVDISATLKAADLEVRRTGKRINWGRLSKRIYEVSREKVSADTLRKEFQKVSNAQSFLEGVIEVEPVLKTPTKSIALEICVLGRGSVGHLFEIVESSEYEEAKDLARKLSAYCEHMEEEWRRLNCYALAQRLLRKEPLAKSADGIMEVRLL